jgi:hypothetical protein
MSTVYFHIPSAPGSAGALYVFNSTTGSDLPFNGLPTNIVSVQLYDANSAYALADDGSVYKLTLPNFNDPTSYEFTLISSGQISCFFGNAPVLTPSGYRRIDSLCVGDKVTTPTGYADVITRVYKRMGGASPSINPYRIPAGTFGATEDLLISPKHSIAVKGKMIRAEDCGLEQVTPEGAITYYNLGLASKSIMIVAGVEVESYY